MNKSQYQDYRTLQHSGVEPSKTNQIRFNSGSETTLHVCIKAIVGHIGLRNGYRVSSEVEVPNGEVDCLLWGHPDRLTLAVEVETSPTELTKKDKLRRYVKQVGPIDDMILINVNDVPLNMIDAAGFVADELGLNL